METESSAPPIWLDQAPVKVDFKQTRSPKHQSSQLTTSSNDTDFTATTTNTTTEIDSIVTSPSLLPRTSQIDLQHIAVRELALRKQYEQRPEKVPDVAAEMEKWFSLTDRYGFLEDDTNEPTQKQKQKEVERAEKWAKMSHTKIINHESAFEFVWSEKFRKRVYKGIPDCWRREAWYFLVTDRLKDAVKDAGYRETYQELLQRETSHERQIDLDIPRTLRDHIMFKQRYGSGQRALFNVLRAFANYDEEVGYCQGMTNIAATLLMYCEEEVFISLFFL
ncbi:RabGAP/TBC [Backusella circina FSU 941]|nr:RabGAP/TBC [Backusella circina FSU 941]